VSTARAFLAATPDSLDAICERYGVEYIVVPPQWYIRGVVMAAGDPLADKMAAHVPLNPQEIDRVVFRMVLAGKPEPPFETGLRAWALPHLSSPAAGSARR
jgi:hypothetical protein